MRISDIVSGFHLSRCRTGLSMRAQRIHVVQIIKAPPFVGGSRSCISLSDAANTKNIVASEADLRKQFREVSPIPGPTLQFVEWNCALVAIELERTSIRQRAIIR